ncbi:MAG: protease Lon-related BREX system protein BrxL [Promethearchaeota archaeon]
MEGELARCRGVVLNHRKNDVSTDRREGGTIADLDALDQKLIVTFPGMIVRKDLAMKLKGAFAVPTYVLEFLLGRYCSSPNEEVIEAGLKTVRQLLEEHHLNPERVDVVKSKIREEGSFKVLDRLKVRLVPSEDKYWGHLLGLGLYFVHVEDAIIHQHERVLLEGVWGIIELQYDPSRSHRGRIEPFVLSQFNPVQLSGSYAQTVVEARKEFSRDEWLDLMLRSMGLEPAKFTPRQKMLLLARLLPFVERNFNYVEFGPRSTGKSFAYRELSPHSLLISGGEASIANLFVSNVGGGKPGLVCFFDVVAFDEVGGLGNLSQAQGLQIFKDYMESGVFSRGKGEFTGKASLVFVGNMDLDIQTALQAAHLFVPFPVEMQDLAFLDRFHAYVPGWELPRFKTEMFTGHFALIVDLLAEYFQLLRGRSFIPQIDEVVELGSHLEHRDRIRVRATTSGLLKLLYPDGSFQPEDVEFCLRYALEFRRRVKEQLRKMGSVEFRRVNFSYIRKVDGQEVFVETPEAAIARQYSPLTREGVGIGFTIGLNELGRYSLYRVEVGLRKGKGTWNATGLAGKPIKDALITVRDFIRANIARVKPFLHEHDVKNFDVHVQVVDLMKAHKGSQTGMGFFLCVLSAFSKIPLRPRLVVAGEMTISGALIPLENLAEIILIAKDNGAQTILLPANSRSLLDLVPPDITDGIDVEFYDDPIQAWEFAKQRP